MRSHKESQREASASLNNLSPLPPSLSKGRGSEGKRGGFAPSLKPLPPLLDKERGTKGVRLTKI